MEQEPVKEKIVVPVKYLSQASEYGRRLLTGLVDIGIVEFDAGDVDVKPAINELEDTLQHTFEPDKLHPIDPTLLRDIKEVQDN